MKYFSRSTQLLILFTFLFTISCQEDVANKETDLIELSGEIEDEDMIAATELADAYLNSSNGRRASDSEKSITVLKFREDKLWYATSSDEFTSYNEVNEETITATVEPGEYIFFY